MRNTATGLVLAMFVAMCLAIPSTASARDKLSMNDKDLIKHAMRQLEIVAQESRLAREHADSDGVKHFAELATREQDEMMKTLHEFCDKHDWAFDADPTRPDVVVKKELEGLHGKEFDRVYMSDMTRELEETYKAFHEGAKSGDDHDLRKWMDKCLPTIQERRDNADELYRKVKAKE